MKLIKKYNGSSLVVTVVVTLILSIICLSLILLVYYNRQAGFKNETGYRLEKNIRSAVNLLLSDTIVYESIEVDSSDLFGEGKDSVKIAKKNWGLYRCGLVKAYSGKNSKRVAFFYGGSLPDSFNGCLYLADHERSLTLASSVILSGVMYLPKAGIKRENSGLIGSNQNSFSFPDIRASNKLLPELHPVVIEEIKNMLRSCRDLSDSNRIRKGIIVDSISRNFDEDALLVFGNRNLQLGNCKISGQVIIISDSSIEISRDARLENIILVAPFVRIKKGFKGTIQVFASDSLVAEDSCCFDYPSSLVLMKEPGSLYQNRMIIGRNSSMKGVIVSLCGQIDFFKSYVQLGSETKVEGVIYTAGYLDLSTEVSGTVLTDFFLAKTPAVVYENYLSGSIISREKLSTYFVPPPLFRTVGRNKVMQWLK